MIIVILLIILLYLKDVVNSYIYNQKGDAMEWHLHIIRSTKFSYKKNDASKAFLL